MHGVVRVPYSAPAVRILGFNPVTPASARVVQPQLQERLAKYTPIRNKRLQLPEKPEAEVPVPADAGDEFRLAFRSLVVN
jgi:hypothetical protein